MNATIPVIATQATEYRRVNEGSRAFRYWSSASGETIEVTMTGFEEVETDAKVNNLSDWTLVHHGLTEVERWRKNYQG